jgi:hypothetical protein
LCKGNPLPGSLGPSSQRGLELLLSAEWCIGNLSGKMIPASLDDKGLNAPFQSRELFLLGASPKGRASFDSWIVARTFAKLG